MPQNVLFVNGIGDDSNIHVASIKKNGAHSFVYSGGTNLFNFIENKDIKKQMLILDSNQTQDIQIHPMDTVFNEISDADTHKMALSKLKNIYKLLPKKTRFLNHPENILKTTRDSVHNLLQGIEKLHVPKTIKIRPSSPDDIYKAIENEKMLFPVIFRKAGDHGGVSTVLLKDENEMFYNFALDTREYYLTQYVETSKDGLYSKYRLVVVDGEVYIRHCIFNDDWIIHSQSRSTAYIKNEQANLLRFEKEIKPKIQTTIDKIYQVLQLDYFGIDCSIDEDMNIILFELNANMNVLIRSNNELESSTNQYRDRIYQAVINMILKASLHD